MFNNCLLENLIVNIVDVENLIYWQGQRVCDDALLDHAFRQGFEFSLESLYNILTLQVACTLRAKIDDLVTQRHIYICII
jgi:hypothetical protein